VNHFLSLESYKNPEERTLGDLHHHTQFAEACILLGIGEKLQDSDSPLHGRHEISFVFVHGRRRFSGLNFVFDFEQKYEKPCDLSRGFLFFFSPC
jgi:hypothetical protein